MHIAIVYASVEGQTRRIAEHVAERLRAAGHAVDLAAADCGGRDALAAAEAAILLAPVHGGRYPAPLVHLAREEAARLNAMPSAFVSVSLGIMGEPDERREAEEFPARLAQASGWQPSHVHHAAGALRFAKYDFFKRWIMRRIARSHGYGDGDREFTDWAGLDSFLVEWLAGSAARGVAETGCCWRRGGGSVRRSNLMTVKVASFPGVLRGRRPRLGVGNEVGKDLGAGR